jgi:N-acetylmuramoyl-L-alanine amidase
MFSTRVAGLAGGLLLALGCAPRLPSAGPAPAAPGEAATLPAVPSARGPLAIQVVYPAATDLVDARDSSFLFGALGTGEATLTINGAPIRVWPNGAWLAWLPLSGDSDNTFALIARTATDSATLSYTMHRVRRFQLPAAPVWIDSTSLSPASRVWWPADEYLPLSLRATEGATVRLRLPDGGLVPLAADAGPAEVPAGVLAFDHDSTRLTPPRRADKYVGALRGRALGEALGPMLGGTPDAVPAPCCLTRDSVMIVEAILGTDTARVRWPLRLTLLDSLPLPVEFNDDTAHKGTSDSLTVGRARPGATYHWFFPTGTRTVATGRLGDDLRVRLSRNQEAWVPAADAIPLASGTPSLRATVYSLTLTPAGRRATLRIPLTQRVPFRIEEETNRLTLRLYNSVADVNWTRYGATSAYVRDIRWLQAGSDEVTITLDLATTVWGYRTRWSGNDLLLELREPPAIAADHPLAGRLIVVDPGHPPAGATGPTGFREAEANLAIALVLRDLLTEAGARVIMTRTTDAPVDLTARTRLADSVDADLLVSIHNNALPDGINPFTNNGSSVFYNQPRSLPLARAIQRNLLHQFGLRDLGVGRGDLAMVRPTWMPAVLAEGLYLMLPEQEAALRSPDGQRRYAIAVRDGLTEFLRGVATGQGNGVP